MSSRENKDSESWDKGVPFDLISSIKHLRRKFERAHFKLGLVTKNLCYSLLHDGAKRAHHDEKLRALLQIKAFVGQVATERFNADIRRQTLPATFKAFYDLYVEGPLIEIRVIF